MEKEKKNINDESLSEEYNDLKGFFPEEYDLTPEELLEQSDFDSFDKTESSTLWDENIVETNDVTVKDEPIAENTPNDTEDIMKSVVCEEEMNENATASKKFSIKQFVVDTYDIIEMFAICTVCIILFFSFIGRLTIVDGDSMTDTLKNGEYLFISNFMYEPEQGDIVVLQDTSLEYYLLKKPLIKRVIATGGQTVDISQSGVVTITNEDGTSYVLDEEYTKDEPYREAAGHYEVPEGCLFVMGDNRNGSTDSRDDRVGYVDERCVIGKAVFRILPLNNAGGIY